MLSPHLAFGHKSLFRSLLWPEFPILIAVCVVACLIAFPWPWREGPASAHTVSNDGLLESGQRVKGVLKSFTVSQPTSRRWRGSASRAESRDAPYYTLQVELWMPTLVRVAARNRQPVPLAEVPKLVVGRELTCVVDPSAPSSRFLVEWNNQRQ